MNFYYIFACTFTTPPMALLGWLGWRFGEKIQTKYPDLFGFRELGLGIGIVLGFVVGAILSFIVAPCGFFGC